MHRTLVAVPVPFFASAAQVSIPVQTRLRALNRSVRQPALAPTIDETVNPGQIVNRADVHVDCAPTVDPNPGDTHLCSNWETRTLVAGVVYELRVEFYENGGDATAILEWESASTPRSVIPEGSLTPP